MAGKYRKDMLNNRTSPNPLVVRCSAVLCGAVRYMYGAGGPGGVWVWGVGVGVLLIFSIAIIIDLFSTSW